MFLGKIMEREVICVKLIENAWHHERQARALLAGDQE
jgi:hypothetical protein